MIKRLLITLVLLTASAWAQQGNSVTIRFAGAPTGSCSPVAYGINNATGELYDCLSGAWHLIGGTGTALSGSGTANTITKWSAASVLTNSNITDNGTTIGLVGAMTLSGLLTSYNSITTAGLGVSPQVGSSVLSSQTTGLGPTTLFTVGAATTSYTVRATVECTTATATATVALTINYTDASNTAQSIAPAAAVCTTLGSASHSDILTPIEAKNATTITYSTVVANSPGGYRVSAQVFQDSVN